MRRAAVQPVDLSIGWAVGTSAAFSCLRLVSVDDTLHQVDQVTYLILCEYRDRCGRAVEDGFGGGDGGNPVGSEGDELAAAVVGMWTALDKPVLLELVDDE